MPHNEAAIEACVREWYSYMLDKFDEDLPDEVKVDPLKVELTELETLANRITTLTHEP